MFHRLQSVRIEIAVGLPIRFLYPLTNLLSDSVSHQKYRNTIYCIKSVNKRDGGDHKEGIRIVVRASDRPRSLSITLLVWDALSGTAVAAFAVAIF